MVAEIIQIQEQIEASSPINIKQVAASTQLVSMTPDHNDQEMSKSIKRLKKMENAMITTKKQQDIQTLKKEFNTFHAKNPRQSVLGSNDTIKIEGYDNQILAQTSMDSNVVLIANNDQL